MEDKTLLQISTSVAVFGIILLLLLSYYDKIPEKKFNDITEKDAGSKVRVNGNVAGVYYHNNSMSINLRQDCYINIFLFDNKQNFTFGENLTIYGTVQEYNGKMNINAEKIMR